ncbi:MAG: DUF4837 family protein [Ekhidna sp.]|nr:DUF4837 family protein [Ekhidna sp.]
MYKCLILASLLVFSCSESSRNKLKSEMLPNSRGEADEIILVADSTQWVDSIVGKELKKTFLTPMLGLPQDEPLFNVSKISPKKLNSVFKSAKNMVFVMTLDSKTSESQVLQKYFTDQSLDQIKKDTSMFFRVQKDLFARGQTALFLFSSSEEFLSKKINYHRSQIREIFEASARKSIRSKLFNSTRKQLEERITKDHNLKLTIPYGWEKARNLKNFFWLRLINAETEQSLFVYYEPYTNQSIFNEIDLFRDKITQKFLFDGENPQVHIERQPQIPVFTERVNFNGHFAVEARGLWRISDLSRGGPFVSYTIVDEEAGLIYYIEGYVDSPGTRKKNLIRELEAILGTFRTKSDISNLD